MKELLSDQWFTSTHVGRPLEVIGDIVQVWSRILFLVWWRSALVGERHIRILIDTHFYLLFLTCFDLG